MKCRALFSLGNGKEFRLPSVIILLGTVKVKSMWSWLISSCYVFILMQGHSQELYEDEAC